MCGAAMNQHPHKVDFSKVGEMPGDPIFDGVVMGVHQCAGCGNVAMRPV